MELIKWNKAKQAIIEAKTIDEIKDIRDKAQAMKAYAKQIGESLEVQNDIAEIKIRAERRAGEILQETEKAKGSDYAGRLDLDGNRVLPSNPPPTLEEIGITKIQSSRWQATASLPEDVFEKHIVETKGGGKELTSSGVLKIALKEKKAQEKEELKENPIQLPANKYNVLLCDPPWEYRNTGFEMSAEGQYSTMSIEELQTLKIEDLAYENSIMFMWATNPLLKEAIELLEYWGFNYKTNFVWIKTRHTAGFYVYGQHELLLIGVRGSMLPMGEKYKSIIQGENIKHSKKPDIVYEIIETMYPQAKYLELFHRGIKRKNWEGWGFESE